VPNDVRERDHHPADQENAGKHSQQRCVGEGGAAQREVAFFDQASRQHQEKQPVLAQKGAAREVLIGRRLATPKDRRDR
jgi:hypothetical protein